jgi:hypothetical protein
MYANKIYKLKSTTTYIIQIPDTTLFALKCYYISLQMNETVYILKFSVQDDMLTVISYAMKQ